MSEDEPAGSIRIGRPPEPPRRRRVRIWPYVVGAAGVLVLVAGVVVAMSWDGPAGPPQPTPVTVATIRGVIQLRLSQFDASSTVNDCWGNGGYDDLREGAQVTVTDPDGRTIALGSVTGSSLQDTDAGLQCVLSFEVEDVPRGAGFYGVEVAHRGVVRRGEADVFTRAFQLTIG